MNDFERLTAVIEKAIQDALDPIVWDLQDTLKAFDDAADRLRDEWQKIDLERAEWAREARKPTGGLLHRESHRKGPGYCRGRLPGLPLRLP